MNYQKPKGTADILPADSYKWQYIEDVSRNIFDTYAYKRIQTPMFEDYALFQRGVGESSDIVSKEMYDFFDKGDRHIALRPEGTASVVRAYVENKLYGPEHQKPQKYYYNGPMFRYENPQGGRMRQFHQLGVEAFGSANPQTDVEVMTLAVDLFKALGLKNVSLTLNSLGDVASRKQYRDALIAHLTPHREELSEDSKRRLEQNPLRILDSKAREDQPFIENAPSILNHLTEESKQHFNQVITLLDETGVDYTVDHTMVRGLDYYTDTVFEIMTDDEVFGAITTICAGGRYNNLVEDMGGPATPAFGFAAGIERLLLTMEAQNVDIPEPPSMDVYIVGIGDNVDVETFKIAQSLRRQGLIVEKDFLNRKPKAQFKSADRFNAQYVLILGEEELNHGTISVKEMSSGEQKEIPLTDIYSGEFAKTYKQN